MKKVIIVLLISWTQVSNAQNTQVNRINSAETKSTSLKNLPNGSATDQGDKVPELIKINFEKSYPGNIAAWTIENKHYMAEFKDSVRTGRIVTFDEYGNILSKQEQLFRDAFPAPIDEYITKNYPNQNFPVWSIVNADGTSLYYFTRDPETIWFDPTGKFRNKTTNKPK